MQGVIDFAVPSPVRPAPSHLFVTADNGVLTPVFTAGEVFADIQFRFENAANTPNTPNTPNTGNVELHVRGDDGSYSLFQTYEPGQVINWPALGGRAFNEDSFRFKTAVDGDGVHVVFV